MSTTTPVHVLRPATLGDLDGIVALVDTLTDPITSIPQDPDYLAKRIHRSLQSFYPAVHHPGAEQYLFVLEGPEGIVGLSAIIARVGGYDPFYTFQITQEQFRHAPLKVCKRIPTLSLKANHDGPTEIGSLFLRPDQRRSGLGRLLSLGRFLFMARFPERFSEHTLAELRGYLDETGRSPFWENVGKPFFDSEFTHADFLSGLGNKSFIRDLMPRHPLYTNLLAPDAQAVIGRVHRHTQPAKALLESEGFAVIDEVDIFDAGPILQTETQRIRSVAECRVFTLAAIADEADLPAEAWHAGNARLDFRACRTRATIGADSCTLPASTAAALRVRLGDAVQLVPARPPTDPVTP